MDGGENIMIKKFTKGFTLVELLIVIALIAAIALIVIAAINPIEQANRARDTQFNSDSAQLVSAIERNYASTNKYPWVGVTGGTANSDAAFSYVTAGSQLVGICGANCSTDGTLITTQELKSEFRNRDFIKNSGGSDNTQKIYVGKGTGSSSSVYACYIPMAVSTRTKACAEGDVYTLGAGGARTQVTPGTCQASSFIWNGSGADLSGGYVCLPH